MFSELSVASMHIKQLEVGAKNIFVVASTELVELSVFIAFTNSQICFPQFKLFASGHSPIRCASFPAVRGPVQRHNVTEMR
jgi:hypothetical protein